MDAWDEIATAHSIPDVIRIVHQWGKSESNLDLPTIQAYATERILELLLEVHTQAEDTALKKLLGRDT